MCSVRIGVLRNFAKFAEKHLCQSLFCNKVAGLRLASLLKKRLWQMFSCEFWEISKNIFFIEHLWATASGAYKLNRGFRDLSKQTLVILLLYGWKQSFADVLRGFLWGPWNILGIYWRAMKYFSKFLMGHEIFSYVLF